MLFRTARQTKRVGDNTLHLKARSERNRAVQELHYDELITYDRAKQVLEAKAKVEASVMRTPCHIGNEAAANGGDGRNTST
jgi:hypothetical protein